MTSELDLACVTVAELATQYLENALSPGQQTSYETHLVLCDNCIVYLGEMRNLTAKLRAIRPDDVDVDERERILQWGARR